jgi:hypothetical protein
MMPWPSRSMELRSTGGVSPSVGSPEMLFLYLLVMVDAGPTTTVKRMFCDLASSLRMASVALSKASCSDTKMDEMGRPTMASEGVPTTSFHDGLTQRMTPWSESSTTTLFVYSAASFRSSRSSRMSSLIVRSMRPLASNAVEPRLRADTAGTASVAISGLVEGLAASIVFYQRQLGHASGDCPPVADARLAMER